MHSFPVHSKYEIRFEAGGNKTRIVAMKELALSRVYDPMLEANLLEEFARIHDDATLLTFVEKYGDLGYSCLVPFEERIGGDPVQWVLEHAKIVRATLELITVMRDGSEKKLIAVVPNILKSLGWVILGTKEAKKKVGRQRLTFTNRTVSHIPVPVLSVYEDWPQDPIRVAWHTVKTIINPQIKGVYYELGDSSNRPAISFEALIQVIYWKVVLEIQEVQLHVCQTCTQLFRATRSDARHCSARCRLKKHRRGQR